MNAAFEVLFAGAAAADVLLASPLFLTGVAFLAAELFVDDVADFFVAITMPHIQSTKGNLCNLLQEQI
ncbi:hypothetical protein [Oxalobacter aliiformigenes]|uniref:hypothetical protein n=1 Tax=Oxalobacter aliiformigenes TaxID=2946593 RepID=UPI0038B318FA